MATTRKVNIEDRYENFNSYYEAANINKEKRNYKAVISSLRSALENLSIIIICDVEGNNDLIINNIFEGKNAYLKDPKTESIKDPDDSAKILK